MQKAFLQFLAVLLVCFSFGLHEASAQVPILSSVDPASAVQGQAVQVTLRGKNFLPGPTSVDITGSGVTITGINVTNTARLTATFTVLAGAAPGERLVTVTAGNGTSSGVSFRVKPAVALPTLTSISPSSGAGGAAPTVTLTGSNFVTGATAIVVSGSGITISNVNAGSPTQATATFTIAGNAAPGPRDVKVVTAGGTTDSVPFTVSASPTLTSIDPASGPKGSQVLVNITGANFVAGQTSVVVNGGGITTGAVNVTSPTSIQTTFTIPSGAAGNPSITVTTPAGNVTGLAFAVTAPISNLTFLDPTGTTPVTEVIVNEASSTQAKLRVIDQNGAIKSGVVISCTSVNLAVATVNPSSCNIQGIQAGFSTLTASAGGVIAATTITVVQVSSSGSGNDATGVVQDATDRLYLASGQANRILLAQSLGQTPQPYAGSGAQGQGDNVPRLQATFRGPSFLAINQADGTLYVSDSANHVIRKVQAGADGQVQTLAGGFSNPQGVALDNRGNIWVADAGDHTIRKINLSTLAVTTVAGLAGSAGSVDGTSSNARFSAPMGIAFEKETAAQELERFHSGAPPPPVRMLVADTGNGLIRRVTESGQVETLASSGAALSADPAKAVFGISLQFSSPTGIATDSLGNIYLTEPGSGRVKTVLRSGDIVDAVLPNTFTTPRGLTVARSGRIVVAAAASAAREIRFGQPQITSVSPSTLLTTGGTTVTINGNNFAPDTTVIIAGTPIANVQIQNTQTISFTAPELPSGKTTVTVQNRGGLAQSLFQVDPVPLGSLSPGYITTVAGGSTFAGDGGAATSAVVTPGSMVIDPNGNLLIADVIGHRIRRIDAQTGIITTIAGNGQYAFSGDDGPAVAAALDNPLGIAVDRGGNLFISDSYNARIRRVDAVSGIITTYAGDGSNGFFGDGGQASLANFDLPTGLAMDSAGNLFVSDTLNNRVRKIDTNGVITTVAGNGTATFAGDNGPGTSASLSGPTGLFLDNAGNLLIADRGNNRIRKLAGGIITTVAGNGVNEFAGDGLPAVSAQIGSPWGMSTDVDGNLFIADTDHSRVRKAAAGTTIMSTLAGNGEYNFYGDDGPAPQAAMREPRAVAIDAGGNVFIADYWDRRIRRVDGKTGVISTFAGNGEGAFLGDNGPATLAVINYPLSVAFDSGGNLFIADADNRVRKVDNTGTMTIVAGGGAPDDGLGDGELATLAAVYEPSGIAFDSSGNTYVSDAFHFRIRKIDAQTKIITTIAGTGVQSFSGDNGLALNATLDTPRTLAMDPSGNLLIADTQNLRIRKVNLTSGVITTVVGNGSYGFSPDGTLATDASLSNVWGFVLDPAGNIYIPDYDNGRVRRIDHITQIMTTVAGGGGQSGTGIPATDAFLAPITLAYDGRLYIMDLDRQGVLRINDDNTISLVAGNGDAGFSGDGGPATAASISYPVSMTFDSNHNFFIADSNNNRIRAVRGPIP